MPVAGTKRSQQNGNGAARPSSEPAASRRGLAITTGDAADRRALKTSESVARDIVDDIVRQDLKAGDSLPSEALMLDQYQVSRQSLREGLRLLESQGLISLRRGPGGGPVVGNLDPGNLGRVATLYYHLAGATYEELLDGWVMAERTLAGLAAVNPDREGVREAMEPYVAGKHPAEAEDGIEEFAAAHGRFHACVAVLANNRVLEMSLQAIGQIVVHHVVLGADPRELEDELIKAHAKIAKAITAGNERRARAAMEEHIRAEAEFYRSHLGRKRHGIIDWQ
jgi:DNA-binding FadR family transcriptional regulator